MVTTSHSEFTALVHRIERMYGNGPVLLTDREATIVLLHVDTNLAFSLGVELNEQAAIERKRISQALNLRCPWIVLRGAVLCGHRILPADPELREAVEMPI